MTAIKVAYQGYDEDSDDADIIVEEEEEFEVVENGDDKLMQAVEFSPTWPGSNITVAQNCCLREVKKVPKKCPILSKIEGYISHGIRILVLMRGCPGSGKSHLARELVSKFIDSKCDPMVYIFSTDLYFSQSGQYIFAPERLPSAHEWNQKRVMNYMEKGFSPIIVDNTNTQVWEMLPYVKFAIRFGYAIQLLEPTTPWCWKESELARRNSHGVSRQKIRSMLDRYEKVTANQVMSSSKMTYASGNAPPQLCSNPIVFKPQKSFPKEQTKIKSKTAIPAQEIPQQCRSSDLVCDVQENGSSPVKLSETSEQSSKKSTDLFMDMKPLQQGLQLTETLRVKSNSEEKQRKTSQQTHALPLNISEIAGSQEFSVTHSSQQDVDISVLSQVIGETLCKEITSEADKISTAWPNENENKDVEKSSSYDEQEMQQPRGIVNSWPNESTEGGNKKNTATHGIDLENAFCGTPGVAVEPARMLIDVEEAAQGDNDHSQELEVHSVEDGSDNTVKQLLCVEQELNHAVVNTCREYVLMGPDNFLLCQKSHNDGDNETEDLSIENLNQLQPSNADKVLSCQGQAISRVINIDTEQYICDDPLHDILTKKLEDTIGLEGVVSKQNYQPVLDIVNVENLKPVNSDTDKITNLIRTTDSDLAFEASKAESDLEEGSRAQTKNNFTIKIVESIPNEKVLPKLDLFSWIFSKKKSTPDSKELQPQTCIKDDIPTLASIEDNIKRVDSKQGDTLVSGDLEDNLVPSLQQKQWQRISDQSEKLNKAILAETTQEVDYSLEHISSCTTNKSCSDVTIQPTEPDENKTTDLVELKEPLIVETSVTQHCYTDEGKVANVSNPTSFEPESVFTLDHGNSMDSAVTDFSFLESAIPMDVVPKHLQELLATAQPVSKDPSINFQRSSASIYAPISELQNLNVLETSDQILSGSASEIISCSDALCHDSASLAAEPELVTGGELGNLRDKYAGAWSKMTPSNLLEDDDIPMKTNLIIPELASKIPMTDSETNTSHSDFSLLEQESPADVRFISAHNRSINDGRNTDYVRAVVTVSTLDKSSMTIPEDFDLGQPDFELLVNMFPKIPREDLKELFDKCLGEMNWTVDLLLESGHAFEPSESLEIRFDNTEDLKVTQQLLEELDMRDMKRSVEFDASNSVTLGFDTGAPAEESRVRLEAVEGVPAHRSSLSPSPTKKGNKKQTSELSLRLKKEMEKNIDLNESSYSEQTLRIKKIRHGQPLINIQTDLNSSITENSASVVQEDYSGTSPIPNPTSLRRVEQESTDQNIDLDVDEDEDIIPLTLDSEFLTQLQTLFGESAFPYLEGVAPVVDVPLTLARQIHGLLMEAQQRQFDMQEKYFENMIKDEEYARRLQEEEMLPRDFHQIMDMEIALELYKADITQVCKETKDDLATRLSKQKLLQLFPSVDPDMLFNVFAAHGNSFQETLEVLEASTGEPEEAVRTVMSPEALLVYEKHLMEQARQESTKQLKVESDHADSAHGRSAANRRILSKDQALAEAKHYREEANRQYQLRNQCYQKANDAMRNGQRAVASYYAQVGRLYKQYIEDANARAAASLLTAHTMSKSSTTLDLHFLFVVEAVQALDIFLDHHISRLSESGKNSQNLSVITGGGNHSMGGRPRIKPAVQRRLNQRGIKYYELNPGHLKAVITRHLPLSNGN